MYPFDLIRKKQIYWSWVLGVLFICFLLIGSFVGGYRFLQNYHLSHSSEKSLLGAVKPALTSSNKETKNILISNGNPKIEEATSEFLSKVKRINIKADSQTVLITPEHAVGKTLLEPIPGQMASPTRMALSEETLYFLAHGQLYQVALSGISSPQVPIQAESLMPNREYRLPTGERIRELLDLAITDTKQIILLDKSNDIYSFKPTSQSWSFALKSRPSNSQPDPHYVALKAWANKIYLLDYARNQIQRLKDGKLTPYFSREVMSWELKSGDPNVVEALDLDVDGNIYTLNREGTISRFQNGQPDRKVFLDVRKLPHTFHSPALRALRGDATSLYVVDAANQRIIKIDKQKGSFQKQWILASMDPDWNRLHDITFYQGKLLVLAGHKLLVIPENSDIAMASVPAKQELLDSRLKGFKKPIASALLPDNPGIFPGARRLYRYGIHEGADFFDRLNPQQGGKLVHYGSPVVAIQSGIIKRIDHDFREMNPTQYQQVLIECQQSHETNRKNEDKFRGRQVWIEHESGVVSVYAHLSKVVPELKEGMTVKQGQKIGTVGNSGTSGSIQGNQINPHLHLEIWLHDIDDPVKGEYLGKWLSLAETRELWESVFSASE